MQSLTILKHLKILGLGALAIICIPLLMVLGFGIFVAALWFLHTFSLALLILVIADGIGCCYYIGWCILDDRQRDRAKLKFPTNRASD